MTGVQTCALPISSLLPGIVHPSQLHNMEVVKVILDMAEAVGPDGFVRQQEAMIARPDCRPMLASIHKPTVVICGRQDQGTPLHCSELMATGIPNARLVVIEECGHMTVLEKRAETSAALRRWLTE